MRILHIVSSAAAGGAEIYVRDLAIHMALQGHNVFILFIDKSEESGRDQAYEASFLHELDSYDISYKFIGKASRRRPWLGLAALRGCCTDFSPDIVHAHLYFAVVFSLLIPGIKLVYTHHNIRLGVNRYFYKLIDWKVSRYVGICYACKAMLETVTRRPVTRIDNGVELSRLLPKVPGSSSNTSLVIVTVGRISEQKNLSLLIDSLSFLSKYEFSLKIAGEGPQRDFLEEKVNTLGLSSRVVFLGNVQNVHQLLNSADIFVMSSEWEGLPIAQIEATLSGLPVVVTNVGGCAEIVHRAINGLVVDERTPEEMARQLGVLLEDATLRNQFTVNALAHSGEYRINVAADKHIKMYREVIAENE